jgi:hypothetical protein
MMKANAVLFCSIPWIVTGIVMLIDGKTAVPHAAFVILLMFPPAVLLALLIAYREGQFDERDRNKGKTK